ncbi:autotransporter outer membrane beta-barrel domain-containing protein [Bergeriella denitrificans]|uniref:IgA-specific metalloendopeptidase n=1 Tax=Bergeriella denitrificans TaxID=494 RepID=A0A378UGN4_BERDE|nr:autotransporter outer membrane beta-barrel domain-containing protein [Bergeriella denitrificans]STZ76465.1 IgA-specific metalloendopeptidase [Bergeriella denitrificans]
MNSKQKIKVSVLAVAAALASVSQSASAEISEFSCANPTGCRYVYNYGTGNAQWQFTDKNYAWLEAVNKREYTEDFWQDDIAPASNGLKVTIAPGTYQNPAADGPGFYKDTYSWAEDYHRSGGVLFGLQGNYANANQNSELNIPGTVEAALYNGYESADLISVFAANAKIEKGARLTIGKSYAELNNIDISEYFPNSDADEYESGTAISIRGDDGKRVALDNAADIILNGSGAQGIYADKADITTHDHTIELNGYYTTAIQPGYGSVITADNVRIIGAGSKAVAIVDGVGSRVTFSNGTIELTGDGSVAVAMGEDRPTTIDNSKISADRAIVSVGSGSRISQRISLNSSEVSGKSALLVLNPADIPDLPDWKGNLEITAANSRLHGETILNTQQAAVSSDRNVVLNLEKGSVWTLNGNSELDMLNIQDSTVKFDPTDGFHTLTINRNLSGNGTFDLNTDLAQQQGDKIVVKGRVAGKHTLNVSNTKTEIADAKLTLVETGSSGADAFVLGNEGQVVHAGKYQYALQQENQNWVLAAKTATEQPEPAPAPETEPAAEPSGTQPAPVPETAQPAADTGTSINVANAADSGASTPAISENTAVEQKDTAETTQTTAQPPYLLSAYVNNAVANVQAARHVLQQQRATLGSRLRAHQQHNRLNGLWLLGESSRSERKGGYIGGLDGISSGFKQNVRGWQMGYDYRFTRSYAGVMAGQNFSDIEYTGSGYSDGKLKAVSGGLYAGTSSENGWFGSADYRYTRFHADGQFEKDRFHTHSVSLAGGKQIALGGAWSLVPQAEVSISRLSSGRYHKAATIAETRAGADIQTAYALGGATLSSYAGAYYVGSHGNTDARFNADDFSIAHAGNRFAARAGVQAALSPSHILSAEIEAERGNRIRRAYQANIGYRYQW